MCVKNTGFYSSMVKVPTSARSTVFIHVRKIVLKTRAQVIIAKGRENRVKSKGAGKIGLQAKKAEK
jgi:hypothetical protein